MEPEHDYEALEAEGILTELASRAPRLALACSFQKEESVLLHLMRRVVPEATVFALDTDLLFPETYETWKRFEEAFGVPIRRVGGPTLEQQSARHGDRLWERDPGACCAIRKVRPLREALSGLDGWVTGVRREQSPTRANAPKLGWDPAFDLWKASPLADWTDERVWSYVMANDLPYHPLHDRGFASIGCMPCTAPGQGRAGRWAGNDKTECGLHEAPAGIR